jgi:hypothetical protein
MAEEKTDVAEVSEKLQEAAEASSTSEEQEKVEGEEAKPEVKAEAPPEHDWSEGPPPAIKARIDELSSDKKVLKQQVEDLSKKLAQVAPAPDVRGKNPLVTTFKEGLHKKGYTPEQAESFAEILEEGIAAYTAPLTIQVGEGRVASQLYKESMRYPDLTNENSALFKMVKGTLDVPEMRYACMQDPGRLSSIIKNAAEIVSSANLAGIATATTTQEAQAATEAVKSKIVAPVGASHAEADADILQKRVNANIAKYHETGNNDYAVAATLDKMKIEGVVQKE